MIRLIIALIGLFLIWVVFFSGFSKERKAVIAVISILLNITGVWFESDLGKPKTGVVQASQIVPCGLEAVHSYRTNFDLVLCFQNSDANANVTRLGFSIAAQQCDNAGVCETVQQVRRDLLVELPANDIIQLKQNLSFSNVDPSLKGISWVVNVHSVKAIK